MCEMLCTYYFLGVKHALAGGTAIIIVPPGHTGVRTVVACESFYEGMEDQDYNAANDGPDVPADAVVNRRIGDKQH